MKTHLRTVLCSLVVAVYAFTGIIGPHELLNHLLNSGVHSFQLETAKKSRPIDSRPIWSQKRHLPSQSRTEVRTDTPCLFVEKPEEQSFLTLEVNRFVFAVTDPARGPSKPRDPPTV